MVLNAFKSATFTLKSTEGRGNPVMSCEVSDCSHLKI